MMLKRDLAKGEVEGEGEEVDDFMYFFEFFIFYLIVIFFNLKFKNMRHFDFEHFFMCAL